MSVSLKDNFVCKETMSVSVSGIKNGCVHEVDCMWVDYIFNCFGSMMVIEYIN